MTGKDFFASLRRRIGQILHSLRFTMIGSVFLIMLTSGVLAGSITAALYLANPGGVTTYTPVLLVLIALPVSVLLGTVFSIVVSKQILRPVDELIAATERISRGDFSVVVPIRYKKNQFSRLIESFNDMTRELSGIEIFRKDFINNFSHEFKTPLSAIRGYVRELSNESLTPAERDEYIRIITEACDRLTGMSSVVLLLAKLENQQFVSERETFDLTEQLRDVLLMQEKDWAKKEIGLQLDLEETVVYSSNSEMLSHVWQNLLSNAIKFCPSSGGVISLSCHREGGGVKVVVADNGCGMQPGTVDHIFEKFYQGDTSHKVEGNGLGLALVKRIVDLHGGKITVDSTPGVGSSFTVCLPDLPMPSDKEEAGKRSRP